MTASISLITPPRRRSAKLYLGAAVLAVMSGICGYDAYLTNSAEQTVIARIGHEQSRQLASIPMKPSRTDFEQRKQFEQVSLERDFDWNGVFFALQRANHPEIELLEFRPEKRQRVMILRGEAKSVLALAEYLGKMNQQRIFRRVYLTRQDLRSHGAVETVGFEMRAELVIR